MVTFYNNNGMPLYHQKSQGNGMTTFNTPLGTRFGSMHSINGNSSVIKNKNFETIGYAHKSNMGVSYTDRFGRQVSKLTPMNNNMYRMSNASGITTGYVRKEPGRTTFLDSSWMPYMHCR